ncbi:MAG: class II SORL domain-containing protein [Coriobacteriia bacterium]|nr:class II SORL domain-containing protein [Coriobacteriia bacterium]MCL2870539.1 class II SORL domain-containing protein [Coriobacteriia bacterium]
MRDFPKIAAPTFIEDPENAGPYEAKHTPHIDIEVIDDIAEVTVTAGYYVTHPNETGHFFEWIMIYAEGQPIAHFVGSPEVLNPTISVEINLPPGTVLEAMVHCNLHGTWKTETTIPGG